MCLCWPIWWVCAFTVLQKPVDEYVRVPLYIFHPETLLCGHQSMEHRPLFVPLCLWGVTLTSRLLWLTYMQLRRWTDSGLLKYLLKSSSGKRSACNLKHKLKHWLRKMESKKWKGEKRKGNDHMTGLRHFLVPFFYYYYLFCCFFLLLRHAH